ncbi:MAG TPA: ATP-binding protein [Trebonia sp.]
MGHASQWPASSTMPPLGVLQTAPSAARAYVATTLAAWGMSDLAAVMGLIVSELVTNGVNASTGPDGSPLYIGGQMLVIQLRLFTDGVRLMAEVCDQAPGVPVRKTASHDDEHWRGLQLVDSLTGSQWGWTSATGGQGKCVWAVVDAGSIGYSGSHGEQE